MDNFIIEKMQKVCDSISADMERDAHEMDGMPFTGQTVARYLGYQCAAIKSLSDMMKAILTDINHKQP